MKQPLVFLSLQGASVSFRKPRKIMLLPLWRQASFRLKTEMRMGGGWFLFSTFLSPLVSLALGPLILRKVGLEEYAVLALAGYFIALITAYYDFGTYPHLLAAFAKKSPQRFQDLGGVVALRGLLLFVFFCLLGLYSLWVPRDDVLYGFLAVSMLALLLPSANTEWFLVARHRHFNLFLMKLAFAGVPVVLTVGWYFSPWDSLLFIAAINLVSGIAASAYLGRLVGMDKLRAGLASLKLVSARDFLGLVRRVLPLALTQLLTPYFIAYSLVWFSMTNPDRELVGAFGIAYRIAVGFSGVLGPVVLYYISRTGATVREVPFRTLLAASLGLVATFGFLGSLLVWFYFAVSGAGSEFIWVTVKYLLILLIAVFFTCLRVVNVSNLLSEGRYLLYFWILFFASAPTLAVSLFGTHRMPGSWVPWLACVPDLLATLGFAGYYNMHSRRRASRQAGLAPTYAEDAQG